jgi:hypothetical protein
MGFNAPQGGTASLVTIDPNLFASTTAEEDDAASK